MTGWLDYRVGDFLLFAAETYWRLFALENAALFPWTALAPLALPAALAFRRRRAGHVALCLLPAACWAVAGASFLWSRYGAINWAAPWAAPLFAAAALGLIAAAFRRPAAPASAAYYGYALIAVALAYPLAAPAFGRDAMTAEVFGVAPDPTAAATLGLSVFLAPGAARLLLRSAAALWLAISAATLLALGEAEASLPAAALAIFLAAAMRRADGPAGHRRSS